jgi:hypothetical protein
MQEFILFLKVGTHLIMHNQLGAHIITQFLQSQNFTFQINALRACVVRGPVVGRFLM